MDPAAPYRGATLLMKFRTPFFDNLPMVRFLRHHVGLFINLATPMVCALSTRKTIARMTKGWQDSGEAVLCGWSISPCALFLSRPVPSRTKTRCAPAFPWSGNSTAVLLPRTDNGCEREHCNITSDVYTEYTEVAVLRKCIRSEHHKERQLLPQ